MKGLQNSKTDYPLRSLSGLVADTQKRINRHWV